MTTPALIMGGAECFSRDLDRLEGMLGFRWPWIVVAVNDRGVTWPRRLDHWGTLHIEKLAGWRTARQRTRQRAGIPLSWDPYTTWGPEARHSVDRVFGGLRDGSSGLYAASIARLALRSDRIVLCGIPMDGGVNEFSGKEWKAHFRYRRDWTKADKRFLAGMRSMSGWTRELLGEPTPEWLEIDVAPGRKAG